MKKIFIIALLFCVHADLHAQLFGKGKKPEAISGPIHEKYMNKIVFAADFDPSLAKGKEIESNFKTDFDYVTNFPLFFRMYLNNTIYNYVKALAPDQPDASVLRNGTIGFNFYVDNVLTGGKSWVVRPGSFLDEDQIKQWLTFRGAFSTEERSNFLGINQFSDMIRDPATSVLLTGGKHRIKVEVFPVFVNPDNNQQTKGAAVATGEFNLTVKKDVIDPNDDKVCLPPSVLKDAALINAIAKAHSARGFKVDVGDVRVVSDKWYIVRNQYSGIIEIRRMYATIGYRNTKDNKCYKQDYTIYQDYDGSKFLEDINFRSDIGIPSKEIPCKCLQNK